MEKNPSKSWLQRFSSGHSVKNLRVIVMQQTRIKIILIVLVFCTLMPSCESSSFKPEDVYATEEKDNSTFSVKITAFRERRTFAQALGGAYYVFESKNKEDRDWRKFLTIAH